MTPQRHEALKLEILDEFRRVRDEIEVTMQKFIQGDTGVAIDLNVDKYDHLTKREDFGEIIQFMRERQGLNVKELANQLRISEDYLLKTEQNITEPSKFFIHRLASACQVNYDDLMDRLYYVKSDDISNLIK